MLTDIIEKKNKFQEILRNLPDIRTNDNTSLKNRSRLHAVTYASHRGRDDRFCRAIESAIRHGINVVILGWEVPWIGLSQKLQAAYNYASHLPKSEVILFTDAFDVLYTQSSDTILQKFISSNSTLLFSAECGCWPHVAEDPSICLSKYPPSPTPYRYLNSGTWIGYAGAASEMLRIVIDEAGQDFDNANDQKLIADLFIMNRFDIKLDYYTNIFQSMHMTLDPPLAHCDPSHDITFRSDSERSQLFNQLTRNEPSVFHFNGGGKAYHLNYEGRVWYKEREHNSGDKIRELKDHRVTVPTYDSHSHVMTVRTAVRSFESLCPSYIDKEYGKYMR